MAAAAAAAPVFWSRVDEVVQVFTSARTSNPRLAVWLFGERGPSSKKTTSSVTEWLRTSRSEEHATVQLLLADSEMWNLVGDTTGHALCAKLVARTNGNPVQSLNLCAASPPSGQGICYRLPTDIRVGLTSAFSNDRTESLPLMPARKQSALFDRMRVRIKNDAVLMGYLQRAGVQNQHQHAWYRELMQWTYPFTSNPDADVAQTASWHAWLALGQSLFGLLPAELQQTRPWLPAVFAFRITWLVHVELESFVEWKQQQRMVQSKRPPTLAQAMRGNPRAANGFETYQQMQVRKQLQAEAYGWKYVAPPPPLYEYQMLQPQSL